MVRTYIQTENDWQDETAYGGFIAVRDIPQPGPCQPDDVSLQTLSKAMEDTRFRVRQAAHDVLLIAREGWFKSAVLRPILEDLDIPRKLHGVVIETGRSDRQSSFLEMLKILSEERIDTLI